jgi:TM2 domain-containing membrane protein YozV
MGLTIEERQLIELRIRNDAPNVVVAYVLWGFLGLISAHRFYLGRPKSAILQILSLVTVVGWLVWWLFDAAMISAYIRDDKAALRDSLTDEMEGERRGGGPRLVPTPMPKAAMAPAAKTEPKTELVLDKSAEPPLTMNAAPKPDAVNAAAAADAKKVQPLILGAEPAALAKVEDPAKPEPLPAEAALAIDEAPPSFETGVEPAMAAAQAWAAAPSPVRPEPLVAEPVFHQPEPEPALEPAPVIPHPEHIDASPIEVFPPHPRVQALEQLMAREPEPAAEEPLRIDRGA